MAGTRQSTPAKRPPAGKHATPTKDTPSDKVSKRSATPSAPAAAKKRAKKAPAAEVSEVAAPAAAAAEAAKSSNTKPKEHPTLRMGCTSADIAALYDGEAFDVPHFPRPSEPAGPAWPVGELNFSYWKFDSQFALQAQVLQRRGWTSIGDPCNVENVRNLEGMMKGSRKRPKRCLYLDPGASEINWIKKFPETRGLSEGGAYRISAFPGMEAACYKRSTAAHMEKIGVDFYPKTYTLPRDRAALLKVIDDKTEVTHWIAKPHNGFSGKGVVAFSNSQKELRTVVCDDSKKANGTVVQRYISSPLLAGGYKCHMRIYIIATQLHPEPTAYVFNDGHVMFATKPFSLDEASLGKGFDEQMHLTNFDINIRLDNAERVLADKPVVGPTAGWGMRRFEQHYTKVTGRSREDLWTQILRISEAVISGMSTHVPTKAACHHTVPGRHFQLFGLDMMPDSNGKVWLLEANDSPGLASCDPYLETRQTPQEQAKNNGTGTYSASKKEEDTVPTPEGLAIRKAMATDERITLAVCDGIYSLVGMDQKASVEGNSIGLQNWFRLYSDRDGVSAEK